MFLNTSLFMFHPKTQNLEKDATEGSHSTSQIDLPATVPV